MLCYNIQMSIYSISIRVRGIWINMLYLQQNGFKGFKWHFYYIFRFCLYWFSFVYCFTRRHLGFPAMLKIWQVPACKMEPKRGIIFWRNFFPPAPAAAPTSPVVIILYFYMSDQTNAVIVLVTKNHQTNSKYSNSNFNSVIVIMGCLLTIILISSITPHHPPCPVLISVQLSQTYFVVSFYLFSW